MSDNYFVCADARGSINISEDVMVAIVRATINEIDGVAALQNTAGVELAELLGIKQNKGIKVQWEDGVVDIDAIIMVRYGSNVVSVAQQVQEAVTTVVESTTGLGARTNVHVSGVAFDK